MVESPADADDARTRHRWLVVGVLVLSTALSFVDRQVLAALAPTLKEQFHLSNLGYGWIVAAFSLSYAVCAPAAGLLIDRVGLNVGISAAVTLWSVAGVATGFAGGLGSLLTCRAALGAAESAGIPATAKGFALYLKPHERAMGTALNQVGITIGMMAAPLLVGWLAIAYGWRAAFVATGIAGLAWIPLWALIARRVPAPAATGSGASAATLAAGLAAVGAGGGEHPDDDRLQPLDELDHGVPRVRPRSHAWLTPTASSHGFRRCSRHSAGCPAGGCRCDGRRRAWDCTRRASASASLARLR